MNLSHLLRRIPLPALVDGIHCKHNIVAAVRELLYRGSLLPVPLW